MYQIYQCITNVYMHEHIVHLKLPQCSMSVMATKVQGQEEKGMAEEETAGWHHRLHGCESG